MRNKQQNEYNVLIQENITCMLNWWKEFFKLREASGQNQSQSGTWMTSFTQLTRDPKQKKSLGVAEVENKEKARNVYESFLSLIPFFFFGVSNLENSHFQTDSLGVEKAS